MDFSLRGSQINLVERCKKTFNKNNYHHHNYNKFQRSYSALTTNGNFPRTSPSFFLTNRPVSADIKFTTRTKNTKNCVKLPERTNSEDKLLIKRNRLLLLNEPIRSSLLYNSFNSNDNNIEENLKLLSEEQEPKNLHDIRKIDPSGMNYSKSKNNQNSGSNGSVEDYRNLKKTDLPGRVSFGKISNFELDYSDGENDVQNDQLNENQIKKIPPATTANTTILSSAEIEETGKNVGATASLTLSTTNKKSVHFGGHDVVPSSSFSNEYCPCICNTKNSNKEHLLSTLDNSLKYYSDNKYLTNFNDDCNGINCKTLNEYENPKFKEEMGKLEKENKIIENYKNEIDDENRKLQLEVKLAEKDKDESIAIVENHFSKSTEKSLDNRHLASSLESSNKFESDFTQVGNLSELKDNLLPKTNELTNKINSNSNNHCYSNQNLKSQQLPNNITTNTTQADNQDKSPPLPSPSSVVNNSSQTLNPIINNYLKVSTNSITTSTPVTNKKMNNSANNKRFKKQYSSCGSTSKSTTSTTRSKSVSPATGTQQQKKQKNLKKSETFSCLRQDSKIDEFHLDNIDSWMSKYHHHHHHHCTPKTVSENGCGNDDQYSKHCHYMSHKYESHEDTDTPEHYSKTTEELLSSSSHDSGDGSNTTYDEIVSVIKEIEEEKKKEMPDDISTDFDMKFQNLLQSDASDISTVRKDEDESPDKLKDILNYLEDVENNCERTLLETQRLPKTSQFDVEPDMSENLPKITDLLMIPNHQLARRVITLSLRANELSNAIQLSKEHLAYLRQEKQKAIRLEKQNTTNRLREQKKHYENMLARHQGFIEQLLKDKGSLCEKVTSLTRRIESQNQAWEHKLETEIARAKEIALAGEKIRREKWVRENTKKIKELTVKGFGTEIEKMNSEHQKEVTELKKIHQQELLNALEEARQKHEQIVKSIREQCAQDRETIIEKERNAIRERFERQLQDEQKTFNEQKNKLLENFASERERLLRELKQKDEEFEKKKQEILKEKEITIEQIQAECNEKLEQQENKQLAKINAIEKQFESDFLIWKREFENACKLREVENENGIRQHYRAERDRQIDAIVSRMDAESQKCQEEFELKLSRLKDKYENDLREVENVEKSLRDKYNETRTKLAESNAEVQNLQAEIKQMKIELEHSRKMCDEFLNEKESMKENVRNEVQVEISALKAERDEEIQKIHKRVQQAIEKKDAAMEILQKDNAALRERCIKLEAIIRQQRKDYVLINQ